MENIDIGDLLRENKLLREENLRLRNEINILIFTVAEQEHDPSLWLGSKIKFGPMGEMFEVPISVNEIHLQEQLKKIHSIIKNLANPL